MEVDFVEILQPPSDAGVIVVSESDSSTEEEGVSVQADRSRRPVHQPVRRRRRRIG